MSVALFCISVIFAAFSQALRSQTYWGLPMASFCCLLAFIFSNIIRSFLEIRTTKVTFHLFEYYQVTWKIRTTKVTSLPDWSQTRKVTLKWLVQIWRGDHHLLTKGQIFNFPLYFFLYSLFCVEINLSWQYALKRSFRAFFWWTLDRAQTWGEQLLEYNHCCVAKVRETLLKKRSHPKLQTYLF